MDVETEFQDNFATDQPGIKFGTEENQTKETDDEFAQEMLLMQFPDSPIRPDPTEEEIEAMNQLYQDIAQEKEAIGDEFYEPFDCQSLATTINPNFPKEWIEPIDLTGFEEDILNWTSDLITLNFKGKNL